MVQTLTAAGVRSAGISEFIGTTLLLFSATVIARWLFGPGSPLAIAVPGLAGRLGIDGVMTGPSSDY